jgi:hypothetical protein
MPHQPITKSPVAVSVDPAPEAHGVVDPLATAELLVSIAEGLKLNSEIFISRNDCVPEEVMETVSVPVEAGSQYQLCIACGLAGVLNVLALIWVHAVVPEATQLPPALLTTVETVLAVESSHRAISTRVWFAVTLELYVQVEVVPVVELHIFPWVNREPPPPAGGFRRA